MTTLLELREKAISVYSQYENYINMGAKFLVVLLGLIYINSQIGYQTTLAGGLPTFLIALICTLIPAGMVVAVYGVIILIHLYSLALEAAAIGAILLLIMLLVYYRFTPRDSMLLLVYPIFRTLGIPYALPIAGGLLYSPASGATVAVGVITDSFIRFVHQNETAISSASGTDTDGMVSRFQFLLDGIMQNHGMIIRVIAVVAAAVAVYLIRRLPIRQAWIIASGAGALSQLLILLIGAMVYNTDISIAGALFGSIASFGVGAVLSFFLFNLDYTRIENTQFEDDDYYYYVKAVPKNAYARPKRTVKTINLRHGAREYAGNTRAADDRYYSNGSAGWEPEYTENGQEGSGPDGRYEEAGRDEYPQEERYGEDGYAEDQAPESYSDDFRDDF